MAPENEEFLCIVCGVYCFLFIVSGMVNLLALTLTVPVYVYFNDMDEKMWQRENPIFALGVEILGRIVETTCSVIYFCVTSLFKSVSTLLPLFMFIVLMSLLNANLDTALEIMVSTYNTFIVETKMISILRRSAWIFKISFEIISPLYNWLIDTVGNINIDLLKLLVDNEGNRSQMTTIVKEFGRFFIVLSRSVADWMYVNLTECKHENIMRDLTALSANGGVLQHRCYDLDYLDFDVSPAVIVGQKIITNTHSLSVSLCPMLSSITALALYPFYDSHMGALVQNILNFGLGFFYTAQVTHSRCRAAMSLSLSTTLCAPDLFPMFRYVDRMLIEIGGLVDNWLNIAHMMLLSFFMTRDPGVMDKCSTSGGYTMSFVSNDEIFAGRPTRILSTTNVMMVMTDGINAVYMNKFTKSEPIRSIQAFRMPVDIALGIAAIDFSGTLLESDVNGDTKTGVLGCRCVEDAEVGVILSCSVALFPAFFDAQNNVQDTDTFIPLLFERGTTGKGLKCAYLRISVESIRFPAQVFDIAQETVGGTSSYNFNVYSECALDPRKCNTIDAIIYVMPLCPLTLQTQKDAGVECIVDSKYQTCFPYCVALHQKGAGNSPMTLYNKRSLSGGGVYMANTKFRKSTASSLSDDADIRSIDATETFHGSTDTSFINRVTRLQSIVQDTGALGPASFSTSQHSVSIDVDTCLHIHNCTQDAFSGASVPSLVRETSLAISQPYLFAGDIILVQECDLTGTKCFWTTSMYRITSDIHSRYSIINKISRIPSIRSSDAKIQSQHGGIILPGETNDVVGKRNPAAQTQSGVVYGVNPNPLGFRGRLQSCAEFLAQSTVFELNCDNCYQTPQVFFTQPVHKCTADNRNTLQSGNANSKTVRACDYNTTVEIKFLPADKFWSVGDSCNAINGGTLFNLFIEEIVYIDALNVAISVKRGPLDEFLWLTGLNLTAWPKDIPMQSKSIYYFLNMDTLKIQADVAWKVETSENSKGQYSVLCQSDSLVPNVASFVTSVLSGERPTFLCTVMCAVATGVRPVIFVFFFFAHATPFVYEG